MGLEVRLLGSVEALADGRALSIGGPKQRALLALLALEPNRPVAAEELCEELWHGAPPARADATLRSYVSRLRKTLGCETVEAKAGGYALHVESLDAQRFERLLQQGRDELARGAAGLAAERLHAALALWRGRALADVGDGGALAAEARRLDELRLVCLEERIEADLALARHDSLVAELRALVEEEPLREPFWRQLAVALYRSGRQAEALAAYGEARHLLDTELGLEPSAELRELERAILRHEVEAVLPVHARHNLPAPVTSFVGRDRELGELETLLREHRLVTLTGMGGAGKTRLALEGAWRQLDVWADGVWLVDLTALSDPRLVVPTVAAAIGVRDDSQRAVADALLAHARPLELLLLLDNCEHLVEACADVARALLRGCPSVRILATSRVPLKLPAERDYALDPLDPTLAVRLFLERAAAVRGDLPSGADALETATAICDDLDGLPLAIELAAARAKALSLSEIATRLDDRFRFLRAWQRVADHRHRTLETTMDWSYGLLEPGEQQLLRRLSVFAGGADLDAVAAVCIDDGREDAAELLGRLVDASLVRAVGEPRRYLLLETVREYARSKLKDENILRRHAEHYLRAAEDTNLALDALGRGPQRPELALREQHNFRAALDWAETEDAELGLRLALALENFWITQALAEGARRFEQLLDRAGEGTELLLRARATRDLAGCLDVLGDVERAKAGYARSGELFREAGDESGVATALFRLGIVASVHEDDAARARELYERSLAIFRRVGDRVGELQSLGSIGVLERSTGDPARGIELVERSIAMARDIDWVWWQARHTAGLATWYLADGRPDEAERLGREFLSLAERTGSRQEVLLALAILARAAALLGDDARAVALWSSVEAVEDGPGRFGKFDRLEYAAAMPDVPRPVPLPLEQAVALART